MVLQPVCSLCQEWTPPPSPPCQGPNSGSNQICLSPCKVGQRAGDEGSGAWCPGAEGHTRGTSDEGCDGKSRELQKPGGEAGFLAGALQGDFRASLNLGEKKMILFARISGRNLTFSFYYEHGQNPTVIWPVILSLVEITAAAFLWW